MPHSVSMNFLLHNSMDPPRGGGGYSRYVSGGTDGRRSTCGNGATWHRKRTLMPGNVTPDGSTTGLGGRKRGREGEFTT